MSTDIHHYEGLPYWGPVSEERMERLLDLMRVDRDAKVLDLGCGRGELLVRLAERYGAIGTGVDRSTAALDLLRSEAARRVPEVSIDAVACPTDAFEPDERYDLVSWMGGPYLGGDYASTLRSLAGWTSANGFLLLGHGFWAAPPPAEYLDATGMPASAFGTHWDNIDTAQAMGLRLLHSGVSSRDEWDAFEGRIIYNVERYAVAHPDAPDPQGRLDQRRRWNEAQQRWGRSVMGFGLYLFQR